MPSFNIYTSAERRHYVTAFRGFRNELVYLIQLLMKSLHCRDFDSVSADTAAAAAGEFDRERKKVKVIDHDMHHSDNMSTVDRVSNSTAADSLNGRRVGRKQDSTDPLGSDAAHEAKTQIALLGIAADRGGARAACGPYEGQGVLHA